jgi:hypothetical protein
MPGEKKQLLVRAATTLGTIWVNALIAEHFKAVLKNEKAITVSNTWLSINFPSCLDSIPGKVERGREQDPNRSVFVQGRKC